jgi:hypothetical protein
VSPPAEAGHVELHLAGTTFTRVTDSCRAAAEKRARSERSVGSIVWTDGGRRVVEQSRSPADGKPVSVLVATGRAEAANGWVTIEARCVFSHSRVSDIALSMAPAPGPRPVINLDLPFLALLPVRGQGGASGSDSGSAQAGSPATDASVFIKAMHKQVPAAPTIASQASDPRDKRFGIAIVTQF